MKCEPFGGSDYCYYCGKDMCTHDGLPRGCEARKPRPIEPKLVAFGCADEANGGKCCDEWCNEIDKCPASFETPNDEGEPRP